MIKDWDWERHGLAIQQGNGAQPYFIDGFYGIYKYSPNHEIPFCCSGLAPCSSCDAPKIPLCDLVGGS
ncbi:MAG: hypothetical protein KAR20_13815 [Candidatus Heimdallarchaeota archaeon]|nr:hypothetical protein [Candidatus Heimdallarchaeota archaeon]